MHKKTSGVQGLIGLTVNPLAIGDLFISHEDIIRDYPKGLGVTVWGRGD